MKISIKFRPSSHSVDGTVVAEFVDHKTAVNAAKVFRKDFKMPCRAFECTTTVYYGDGEGGCLEDTKKKMIELGAKKATIYFEEEPQILTITIKVPHGVTRDSLPLVADLEISKLIKLLTPLCTYKKREGRKYDFLEFKYEGDRIFYVGGKTRTFETYEGEAKADSTVSVRGQY